VGKNNRIEVFYRKRQLPILIGRFLSLALEHPAVKSDCMTIYVQKMTGACDLASRPDKGYLQRPSLLLRHRAETIS
jgi:hypothetical protein